MKRYLSATEMQRLGEALTAEIAGKNPVGIAGIRLLILTGARKSEILMARWSQIDWGQKVLRVSDSKTGAKEIMLGPPALAMLEQLPRMAKNDHILPGEKQGGYFVGLPKLWERVRTKAKLPDVRLHDLRHSFASVGATGGDSLIIIGALLGHRHAATTQRYAHLSDDPKRAAAERISNSIAALLAAGVNPETEPTDTQTQ